MAASIILSDNGVSSGTSGIKPTGGNDGTLQLQTTTSGGTATTALTIDTSQNTTLAGYLNAPNTFGFKNRIINGAMMIDQRNAGASITPANSGYTVDRFVFYSSQASKFTAQQNAGSVTPPVGFVNYLGLTSTSAYSVGSTDYFTISQVVEGLNVADLGWGAVGAAPVTLSFKVYSSLTGTFGGAITNSGSTRSYPFSYSIPVANTWTNISITIPGDTSGTWLKTNGNGMTVHFGLGIGATYSGAAGSWAGTNYISATGATSVVGTNGATFYITGVQLEKGSTATSFDYRPYGTELILCQRYYQPSSFSYGAYANASLVSMNFTLFTPMRTTPSYTLVNGTSALVQMGAGAVNVSSPAAFYGSTTSMGLNFVGSYAAGATYATLLQGYTAFSAEL